MELIEQVGRRIQEIRKIRGMSQDELGDKLGVTRSFISKLENGKKKISLEHVENIAKILHIEPTDLLVDKTELIKNYDDLVILREKFTKEEIENMVRYSKMLIELDKNE
ncbi:helix-turn-helix domain-containing protein [Rossellomorea aquimaris]|uniref:helix-turn-helix domain-containing protein n=1 Tax=Rossellomorea aquimaris TaxID=189382 RepID=UPI0011E8BAE0|nr:helix-turn-helix transcriptional regulator [Rossellomorea aquimaris]TYS91948.1 helix-turn-helix transcriptional regulator [Rossellomorea aquimaris]